MDCSTSFLDCLSHPDFLLLPFCHIGPLEIVEDGPERLVVKSTRGELTFDPVRRKVLHKERVLSRFDEIKSSDLTRMTSRRRNTGWWIWVSRERRSRTYIGRTTDDVQACIVAAQLARVTGKPSRAVR